MPAILASEISVINAQNFIETIYSDTANYFVSLGKTTEWADENVPPTPEDTITYKNEFRDDIIGIKKIITANAALLVPRVNWAQGVEFKPLSTTIPAPYTAQNYYCITSNNDVYECIHSPSIGAVTGNFEPVVKSSNTETGDGFRWKYLYTVPINMINSHLLLETWMPVPYGAKGIYPGGTLTEEQYEYGDTLANLALGAHRSIVVVEFEDEGEVIPYNISYRQVGVLVNPLNNTGEYLDGNLYAADDFDTSTGQFIYLENRRPIYREVNQSENIQLILVF